MLALGIAACTDTTQEPTSTITESPTAFNDPRSYVAFLAKIYAGLAVSGQQGPAGQPGTSPASTKASRNTCGSTGKRRSCQPTKR